MKIRWIKDFKQWKAGELYECKDRNFDYLVSQGLVEKVQEVKPVEIAAVEPEIETAAIEPEVETADEPVIKVKRAGRKTKTSSGN